MSHFQTSEGVPELSSRLATVFTPSKPKLLLSALYAWLVAIAVTLPWFFKFNNGLSIAKHIDVDVYRQGTIAFLKKEPINEGIFRLRSSTSLHLSAFWRLNCRPFAWMSLPSATLALSIVTFLLT